MPRCRRIRRGFAALHQHIKIGAWKPAGHQHFNGTEHEVHHAHGIIRLALIVFDAQRLRLPVGPCAMRRSDFTTIGRADVRELVIFSLFLAKVFRSASSCHSKGHALSTSIRITLTCAAAGPILQKYPSLV